VEARLLGLRPREQWNQQCVNFSCNMFRVRIIKYMVIENTLVFGLSCEVVCVDVTVMILVFVKFIDANKMLLLIEAGSL